MPQNFLKMSIDKFIFTFLNKNIKEKLMLITRVETFEENTLVLLRAAINAWLQSHPKITVINVSISQSSIFYYHAIVAYTVD
jgi:hypothetical protein